MKQKSFKQDMHEKRQAIESKEAKAVKYRKEHQIKEERR